MTFSIIGRDDKTGELGIAVQSKAIAIGATVPWAKATAGAFVNQSLGGQDYGERAMALLSEGKKPDDVLRVLLDGDPLAPMRQLGILSKSGMAAAYSGACCAAWAGAVEGSNYCCVGNVLAGPTVLEEMAASFLRSSGELAERLLSALDAGQAAGGDKRGMQSAALLVVREGWGFSGTIDRYIDLRVDEHPSPILELRRIYELHRTALRQWLAQVLPGHHSEPDGKA